MFALASHWLLPISNPCHLLVVSLLLTLFILSIQGRTYLAVTTVIVSYLFIVSRTCFCSLSGISVTFLIPYIKVWEQLCWSGSKQPHVPSQLFASNGDGEGGMKEACWDPPGSDRVRHSPGTSLHGSNLFCNVVTALTSPLPPQHMAHFMVP